MAAVQRSLSWLSWKWKKVRRSLERDIFEDKPLHPGFYHPSSPQPIKTIRNNQQQTDDLQVPEPKFPNKRDKNFMHGSPSYTPARTLSHFEDKGNEESQLRYDDVEAFDESWPTTEQPSTMSMDTSGANNSLIDDLSKKYAWLLNERKTPTKSVVKEDENIAEIQQTEVAKLEDTEQSTISKYLSRFRHSEATSRNERKLKNKTLEGEFWWLQDGQSAATSTLDTSGGQESSVLSVNKQQQSALKSRKKLSDLVENGTSQTSTEHILTTERLQQHTALHQPQNPWNGDRSYNDIQEKADILLRKTAEGTESSGPIVSTEGLGSEPTSSSVIHVTQPMADGRFETAQQNMVLHTGGPHDILHEWRLQRRQELRMKTVKQLGEPDTLNTDVQRTSHLSQLVNLQPSSARPEITHVEPETTLPPKHLVPVASPSLMQIQPSFSSVPPHLHLSTDIIHKHLHSKTGNQSDLLEHTSADIEVIQYTDDSTICTTVTDEEMYERFKQKHYERLKQELLTNQKQEHQNTSNHKHKQKPANQKSEDCSANQSHRYTSASQRSDRHQVSSRERSEITQAPNQEHRSKTGKHTDKISQMSDHEKKRVRVKETPKTSLPRAVKKCQKTLRKDNNDKIYLQDETPERDSHCPGRQKGQSHEGHRENVTDVPSAIGQAVNSMFLNSTCSSVSSSAEFTNVSKMSNSHGNEPDNSSVLSTQQAALPPEVFEFSDEESFPDDVMLVQLREKRRQLINELVQIEDKISERQET